MTSGPPGRQPEQVRRPEVRRAEPACGTAWRASARRGQCHSVCAAGGAVSTERPPEDGGTIPAATPRWKSESDRRRRPLTIDGNSRQWKFISEVSVNEFETPAADLPVVNDTPPAPEPEAVPAPPTPAVNPIRSAAGRLGAKRRQQLTELGRQYEQEHGLTPGRQRLRQLIQLGKRYEHEHGLRVAKPRKRAKGDAWAEFLAALARVVKPAYRPAVEKLVAPLGDESPK